MAIEYLKKGLDEKQRIEDNDKVKKIVEETLRKIESDGDKHIRELSQKFDNYSPNSFRLSEDQINQLVRKSLMMIKRILNLLKNKYEHLLKHN